MQDDPLLDATLAAAVARAPAEGWTRAMLRRAAAEAGAAPDMAESLFPRGPVSAVAAWSRATDRRVEALAASENMAGLRTPQRVRRAVELRLALVEPHREALRGALGLLALPWNAALALRLTAETASSLWYAAGDRSADFSWYTRRATLAAVYGATLAFLLSPREPEMPEVLAFLDRRLADIAPRRKTA